MTRKPLPKAIRQPIGELGGFAPGGGVSPLADTSGRRDPSPYDGAVAEPALAVSSAPIANDMTMTEPVLDQQLAAKRRALALKIVARHRNMAAAGGLVPIPAANIASVTAINLRMVKKLSELYGVPFERDRARSLIVGLIGGVVPTGVGAATSSLLMWIVPGGLLVGLGASAITAGALTRGIGLVFVESFESGAK